MESKWGNCHTHTMFFIFCTHAVSVSRSWIMTTDSSFLIPPLVTMERGSYCCYSSKEAMCLIHMESTWLTHHRCFMSMLVVFVSHWLNGLLFTGTTLTAFHISWDPHLTIYESFSPMSTLSSSIGSPSYIWEGWDGMMGVCSSGKFKIQTNMALSPKQCPFYFPWHPRL